MDFQAVAAAGRTSAGAVERTVFQAVAAAIPPGDIEGVAQETGLDRDRLAAIADGEQSPLTLAEVGQVLALTDEVQDSRQFRLDVRDLLLVWMSEAVIDVPTLAAQLGDCQAQTLRQQIDGERPLSIETFARIVSVLQDEA